MQRLQPRLLPRLPSAALPEMWPYREHGGVRRARVGIWQRYSGHGFATDVMHIVAASWAARHPGSMTWWTADRYSPTLPAGLVWVQGSDEDTRIPNLPPLPGEE